jgi:hypothetical protein
MRLIRETIAHPRPQNKRKFLFYNLDFNSIIGQNFRTQTVETGNGARSLRSEINATLLLSETRIAFICGEYPKDISPADLTLDEFLVRRRRVPRSINLKRGRQNKVWLTKLSTEFFFVLLSTPALFVTTGFQTRNWLG